jgi:aldehyde dehydrogenase (NAD+)
VAETFHNWIGGRWVQARSQRTFFDVNPATGEVLGEFPDSEAADVEDAVQAARAAQRGWRLTPAPKRGELLFRLGALVAERKEELARAATREMGKILIETRGDVQEAVDMAYLAGGEGRRLHGVTTPSEMPNKWAMSVREPVGVVGIITPWNFPMAVPSWKIFPALVAGNAIVFKPAEDTPWTAWNLARLLEEAGLPPGVLNVVFGDGPRCGAPLVSHPGVDAVSFTGSNDVGKAIAVECARLGKRLTLEMGGKNAVIVLDDADVGLAADAIAWSAFGTTGQRCTACSRVIVQSGVHDELLRRVTEKAARLRLGDGLEPTTEIGPVINKRQLERIDRYVKIGTGEGAKAVLGGAVAAEGPLAKGFFYPPTVLAEVRPEMRVAQEEIFGPVLSFIRVPSLEAAIDVNNGTPFGLSSAIFTRDVNAAFQAMRDLGTGIVYVNHGTTGAETHLPFGGTRGTGNGRREAGHTMLDAFTEWKSIYVDFSGRVQRAQIDNN